MEELEKLEYPKPRREFIYETFNAFADKHPWIGQENIRPKSIVREMFEQFRSFADYIKDYELQRAEGVLLRHLNSTFKVLAQTVPDSAKTDVVREMEVYLATMIRQVDSSLLDEWEKMRDPNYQRAETKEVRPPGAEEAARDITRDTKAFTAAIRNRIFTFLRGVLDQDYETALVSLDLSSSSRGNEAHVSADKLLARPHPNPLPQEREPAGDTGRTSDAPRIAPAAGESLPLLGEKAEVRENDAQTQPNAWTADRLRQTVDGFYVEHQRICLDPNARNLRHTYVLPAEDKKTWRVQQVLVDPEEHNDWIVEFEVDLAESRAAEEPVLRLQRVGSLV